MPVGKNRWDGTLCCPETLPTVSVDETHGGHARIAGGARPSLPDLNPKPLLAAPGQQRITGLEHQANFGLLCTLSEQRGVRARHRTYP